MLASRGAALRPSIQTWARELKGPGHVEKLSHGAAQLPGARGALFLWPCVPGACRSRRPSWASAPPQGTGGRTELYQGQVEGAWRGGKAAGTRRWGVASQAASGQGRGVGEPAAGSDLRPKQTCLRRPGWGPPPPGPDAVKGEQAPRRAQLCPLPPGSVRPINPPPPWPPGVLSQGKDSLETH